MYIVLKGGQRCNFTNTITTIRIFVKGFKNAHNCIYEKGPQTLTDAISVVERLHATQQLTAHTYYPHNECNVSCRGFLFSMPGIRSHSMSLPQCTMFECDEYGHIVVDSPCRMPPSGTPACHHRSQSWHRHHNRSTSNQHPTDRHRCSRSRSQSHHQGYHS